MTGLYLSIYILLFLSICYLIVYFQFLTWYCWVFIYFYFVAPLLRACWINQKNYYQVVRRLLHCCRHPSPKMIAEMACPVVVVVGRGWLCVSSVLALVSSVFMVCPLFNLVCCMLCWRSCVKRNAPGQRHSAFHQAQGGLADTHTTLCHWHQWFP